MDSNPLSEKGAARVVRFDVPPIVTPAFINKELNLLNRIAISFAEGTYFSGGLLKDYDAVLIFHMAHAFGTVLGGYVPMERTVILPMFLGEFYRKFMGVAQAYIDMEREVLQAASHIQTPSAAEKKVLVENYGAKEDAVFVVPRGFNPELFRRRKRELDKSRGRIDILCANVVRMQKGQHILVPILEVCEKLGTNAVFHLPGVNGTTYSKHYNEYAESLRAEIEERGFGNNFKFYGVLDQKQLGELMLTMDMAIYPSVAETFGKSALESMATGLPTIVFDDVPAFGEFIEHRKTGLLVKRSPESAAVAIAELAKDGGLYSSVSNEGIERGRDFEWGKVIPRLLDELVGRLGGREG